MRKLMISMIAAGIAVGAAAPASAQFYPAPTYRYQPYNYNHGWNTNSFGRAMAQRVQRIRSDIRQMHARRILSNREFQALDQEARTVERRIYRASHGGIGPGEARNIERKIDRLERHVMREATDWNHRYGRRH